MPTVIIPYQFASDDEQDAWPDVQISFEAEDPRNEPVLAALTREQLEGVAICLHKYGELFAFADPDDKDAQTGLPIAPKYPGLFLSARTARMDSGGNVFFDCQHVHHLVDKLTWYRYQVTDRPNVYGDVYMAAVNRISGMGSSEEASEIQIVYDEVNRMNIKERLAQIQKFIDTPEMPLGDMVQWVLNNTDWEQDQIPFYANHPNYKGTPLTEVSAVLTKIRNNFKPGDLFFPHLFDVRITCSFAPRPEPAARVIPPSASSTNANNGPAVISICWQAFLLAKILISYVRY